MMTIGATMTASFGAVATRHTKACQMKDLAQDTMINARIKKTVDVVSAFVVVLSMAL